MKAFVIVSLVVLFSIGWCSTEMYQMYQDFPEYAKEPAVREKYGDYLSSLEQVIDAQAAKASDGPQRRGFFQLAAATEQLVPPEELLFLGLLENGAEADDYTAVIGAADFSSRSQFLISGFGYGSLNGQPILIVEQPVEHPLISGYLVYFRDQNRKRQQQ